ncbi:MAG: ABC transporter ATP-binding protein [Spirochaetales bacterium]|nr:ABC transporter ATP-binding protein [Spirochaetales bacterium]
MNIIELKNITKTYAMGQVSVEALKGVSLSIAKGDFVAVSGPSGAGKTTIMNMIGLVDEPTDGEVCIDGSSVSGLSDRELTELRHRKLGFIFQSFNLMPVLNVFENIELPLLIGKDIPSRKERVEFVDYLVGEVGLTRWRGHRPSELSGGQRQRVAIARALVTRPEIVIADEPTANLDSATGESILNLMKEINRERQTTFVFSTHDGTIRNMADQVIQLHDGRVVS